MKTHTPTDYPLFYNCYNPETGVRHVGETPVGSVTVTGQPEMISADNMEDLISQSDGVDFTNWREVPERGEYVDKGMYSYNGKLIVCYQAHVRTEHAIEDIPALFGMSRSVLAEWVQPFGAHDAYQTGDEVMFNGTQYRSVIDANVWSPAVYSAGWEEV